MKIQTDGCMTDGQTDKRRFHFETIIPCHYHMAWYKKKFVQLKKLMFVGGGHMKVYFLWKALHS